MEWRGPKGEVVFMGPGERCPDKICQVYKGQYHHMLCKIGYPKQEGEEDGEEGKEE
jgi:hypothetical protein